MVYDCFCFFNELDLLELRFNILDEYVDYFVVCESSVTHTGQPKPFYFEENNERFNKFLHKVIHLKITDTPDNFVELPESNDAHVNKIYSFIRTQTNRFNPYTQVAYGRDFYQKECIRRALDGCNDFDIIMSSDCDEIPNPTIFAQLDSLLESGFLMLNQNTYYYYLNVLKQTDWKGTRIGRYRDLKDYSYNELRGNNWKDVSNGGWHFSFMGGVDMVKHKIESYSAQEMNSKEVLNNISNNMAGNIDPFFRGGLQLVEIDASYPEYLLNNLKKYKHLIK